jgi:uncharacterized membrane protein YbjE (DUF340 family)
VEVVSEMAKIDHEQAIPSFALKVIAFAVPAYIISRVWTAHPHVAFGLGIAVGSVLQHFIQPRGKPLELCFLLLLAVIGAFVDSRFSGY